MTRSPRTVVPAVAPLLLSGLLSGLLSACDSEPPRAPAPQIGAEGPSSEPPASQGSDAAGDGRPALPTSVPEVGLELAYDEPGDRRERAAMAAYATFEAAVRDTLRTARLDPRLPDVAAAPVVDGFRDTVAYLRRNDVRFEGTARAEVAVEETSPRIVALAVCLDGSDVRQVEAGEPRRLDGRERGLVRVLMVQSPEGDWLASEYRELDRPC